jgi:hypothetical protein
MHQRMKARFMLFTQPGSASFRLRKEGEEWEFESLSVRDAMLHARTLPNGRGTPFIIHDGRGQEIAHMIV